MPAATSMPWTQPGRPASWPSKRRRRGDPGPDRQPATVRDRPGVGQARRARAAGETIRQPHGPHQADQSGSARAAARGLRAVWAAQRSNPVYVARYHHFTTREANKLKPAQAQTVFSATILRHLHADITTGQAWNSAIATHSTKRRRCPSQPEHRDAQHAETLRPPSRRSGQAPRFCRRSPVASGRAPSPTSPTAGTCARTALACPTTEAAWIARAWTKTNRAQRHSAGCVANRPRPRPLPPWSGEGAGNP